METHPALEETAREFYLLPVGTQPEISRRRMGLLVSSFERTRGADLALGNIWVSFHSKFRSRTAREIESLFIDVFFVLENFRPHPFGL